jgi:hypothetical protein
MLFAAAVEAASNGEEQTQTSPENVTTGRQRTSPLRPNNQNRLDNTGYWSLLGVLAKSVGPGDPDHELRKVSGWSEEVFPRTERLPSKMAFQMIQNARGSYNFVVWGFPEATSVALPGSQVIEKMVSAEGIEPSTY